MAVIVANAADGSVDLVVRRANSNLIDLSVDIGALADMVVKTNDGKGISAPALSALWGLWMRYTVPRIRAGMSG